LKPKKEIKTESKLKPIIKKHVKNQIRKKDKIIFHNGEGEFPFGFALSNMPRGCFGIYEAEDMFDKKGSLTGVAFNLESTFHLPENDGFVKVPDDGFDVPEDLIVIRNRSQERDEFFTIYLSDSVTSKFNISENDFTLVKCRIAKSIVEIYLSKPVDVAKKPPAGKVSFFHGMILFSDDVFERLQEFANSVSTQEGPKR
jgi:hypothetical protein